MITANHITKSYAKQAVLREVTLEIASGSFTVVLGPSGSGKSTLLNILSGLERPDSGTIRYDDTDITALSDRDLTRLRREKIGFLFQQYYLLANLNVKENVRMGADLASNKAYPALLEAVGLADKAGRYPGELSGGEQQRVSLARALAKKPEVLYLDEPTGALDEETGRSILDYLFRLHGRLGFTIIMVTHNENIAQMADTVIRMNSGRIVDTARNAVRKGAYEIGW